MNLSVVSRGVVYDRKQIGEGIFLSTVTDKKFKTNSIVIKLLTSFDANEASARAMIASLLSASCEEYPQRKMLSSKLASLYNATVNGRMGISGNSYVVSLASSCIADEFTIDGEDITAQLAKIAVGCLMKPNLNEDKTAFNSEEFELQKRDLAETINSEINNKRNYAFMRACKTIYRGEKGAVMSYGDMEQVNALSAEKCYELYLSMLRTAHIEVLIGASGDVSKAVEVLQNSLSELPRENVHEPKSYIPSVLKATAETVYESVDVRQTRLVMAYKANVKSLYTAKLLVAMFGGTPTSKLFMNVREKMQLCYTCSAVYSEKTSVLLVESGIDDCNLDKVTDAVDNQLKAIVHGDFTDKDLEETKLMLTGAFRVNYDSLTNLVAWYDVQNERGTCYTPDEVIDIFNSITREDIIECAKAFKLDTVYALRPASSNGGKEQCDE